MVPESKSKPKKKKRGSSKEKKDTVDEIIAFKVEKIKDDRIEKILTKKLFLLSVIS